MTEEGVETVREYRGPYLVEPSEFVRIRVSDNDSRRDRLSPSKDYFRTKQGDYDVIPPPDSGAESLQIPKVSIGGANGGRLEQLRPWKTYSRNGEGLYREVSSLEKVWMRTATGVYHDYLRPWNSYRRTQNGDYIEVPAITVDPSAQTGTNDSNPSGVPSSSAPPPPPPLALDFYSRGGGRPVYVKPWTTAVI